MKIVHVADTHLGFRQLTYTDAQGRNQREQDVYDVFAEAIKRIADIRPAAVVHAGDLFDGYHPTTAALTHALDGLRELERAGIPFVVIAGNHSTPRFAGAEHVFSLLNRFGAAHVVWREPEVVRVGELAIHALPHRLDPTQLADDLKTATPDSEAEFNVLVAHLGLEGLPKIGTGEAGSISIAGDALQSAAGFNYIALGHFHAYGPVRENAAYAGSLERLSWADQASEKGFLEVDLGAGRESRDFVRRHPVQARPRRILPEIDANGIDDLTAAILAAVKDQDLERAIVRLPIRNATVGALASIDQRAINQATATRCLHFELDAPAIGVGSVASPPPDFRSFMLAQCPEGLDSEEFLARASNYLEAAGMEVDR